MLVKAIVVRAGLDLRALRPQLARVFAIVHQVQAEYDFKQCALTSGIFLASLEEREAVLRELAAQAQVNSAMSSDRMRWKGDRASSLPHHNRNDQRFRLEWFCGNLDVFTFPTHSCFAR
jgi:hypothetical protein